MSDKKGPLKVNGIVILSIVIACLVIALVVMTVKMAEISSTMDKMYERLDMDTIPIDEISKVGGEELTGKDLSSAITTIEKSLSELREKNMYINCYENDTEYASLIYNASGESITQGTDGSIVVFLKDNNSVSFGDNISYGMDTDALTTLELAVKMARNGSALVHTVDLTTDAEKADGVTTTEYLVDVMGWDNLEKMYDLLSEGLGADMTSVFKTGIEAGSFEEDTSQLNFRYAYIVQDGKLVSAGCYMYFGEVYAENWSDCYVSWYFDGYQQVGDWSLQEDWYTYDYSKMADDEGKQLQEMLNTLYESVNGMLIEYGGQVKGETSGTTDGATGENSNILDITDGNLDLSGGLDIGDIANNPTE